MTVRKSTYIDTPYEWHDSIFSRLDVQSRNNSKQYDVHILLLAYGNRDSRVRKQFFLNLNEVRSLTTSVDFIALRDNAFAGNFSNGAITKIGRLFNLRIYLVDGYLDITASRFSIDQEESASL